MIICVQDVRCHEDTRTKQHSVQCRKFQLLVQERLEHLYKEYQNAQANSKTKEAEEPTRRIIV